MKPQLLTLRSERAHDASDRPSGDSLGRGMDIALTLLVFLGVGALLDHWLGLFPLCTIVLVVFAALGTFVRLKYTYDAAMERLEAERRALGTRDHAARAKTEGLA